MAADRHQPLLSARLFTRPSVRKEGSGSAWLAEAPAGAATLTRWEELSIPENRTCGAPQFGQKGELSSTAEPQRWQGCSTLLRYLMKIAAANPQLPEPTLNGVVLAVGVHVHQGEVSALAIRLNGDNVLIAFRPRLQFDYVSCIVGRALQLA
jgi:hypothetical protein